MQACDSLHNGEFMLKVCEKADENLMMGNILCAVVNVLSLCGSASNLTQIFLKKKNSS